MVKRTKLDTGAEVTAISEEAREIAVEILNNINVSRAIMIP